MEESALKKLAGSIDGLTSEESCFLLYSLVKGMGVGGDVLEIGSFKGRVTVCLAKGLKERGQGKVYSIDSNLLGAKEEFLQNISRNGVADRVVPYFANSARVNRGWCHPLAFIWHDTDADYPVCVSDFVLWEPHLCVGGILAFSLANTPQVKRFAQDYLMASGRFERVTFEGPVVFAYKGKSAPRSPEWRMGLTRTAYSFYYAMKKLYYNFMKTFFPSVRDTDFIFKRIIKYFFGRILKV